MDEGRVFGVLGARTDTTGAKGSRVGRMQRALEGGGGEDGGSEEEDEEATDGSIQRMQFLLGTTEHMSKVGREDGGVREQDSRISAKPSGGSRVPIQGSDGRDRRSSDQSENVDEGRRDG